MVPPCVDSEWVSVALTALAGLGGVYAFRLGRREYREAQLWKRKEFVAAAMKDFSADPQVRNALQLVDWAVRRVNLSLSTEADPRDWPVVRRADQIAALRPHTLLSGDDEEAQDSVKDGSLCFTPLQALIRDTYDALFDAFERFAGFVSARLVQVDDLEPYLSYWIKDIAAVEGSEEDCRWTLAIMAYISFYSFSGTVMLFKSFGHDIKVRGELWRKLAAAAHDEQLVSDLELACARQAGTAPPPGQEHVAGADRA